jgi:DNA-binding transcriptional LysR family regulator
MACVSRGVSADYHERIVALCTEAGFTPEIRYELRHWLSVVSLVSQGLGVALVPQALQLSALPGAAFVALSGSSLPYDTYCLWKQARDHQALSAFVEAVRVGVRA